MYIYIYIEREICRPKINGIILINVVVAVLLDKFVQDHQTYISIRMTVICVLNITIKYHVIYCQSNNMSYSNSGTSNNIS